MTVENFAYGLHKEIYGNARALWRTEQLLRKDPDSLIKFPVAYREWINSVYADTDWDEPDNIVGEHFAFMQSQMNKVAEAQRLTTMTMSQFRDEDERITSLTRDGEMSLTVVPMLAGGRFLDGDKLNNNDDKGYAEAINLNSVPVPASWGKYLHECRNDDDGRIIIEFVLNGEDSWVKTDGRTTFRYSEDFGLEKE